jgi:hypothetical protein
MAMGIKKILMKRDGMTEEEAEDLIQDCKEDLVQRLGDDETPMEICAEWFGLEPDYIDELLPL